jgi:hypothetical protein
MQIKRKQRHAILRQYKKSIHYFKPGSVFSGVFLKERTCIIHKTAIGHGKFS